MNMDIDGVFTLEPTEIFPPKREAHEKWKTHMKEKNTSFPTVYGLPK